MLHNNVIEINQGIDIKKYIKSSIVIVILCKIGVMNPLMPMLKGPCKQQKSSRKILNILDGMKLEGKHNEQKIDYWKICRVLMPRSLWLQMLFMTKKYFR